MELCAAAATALQTGCAFGTRNRCRANDGLEGESLQECPLGIGMCLEEDSAGRRKHVS